MNSSRLKSKGTVLLFAVAAVVLITVLAAALTATSVLASRAIRRAEFDERLVSSAESSIEVTIHELASSRKPKAVRFVEVCGHNVRVTTAPLAAGKHRISALASARGRQCEVVVTVLKARERKFAIINWTSRSGPSTSAMSR